MRSLLRVGLFLGGGHALSLYQAEVNSLGPSGGSALPSPLPLPPSPLATLMDAVGCTRLLTMEGSTQFPLLKEELEARGVFGKVSVQSQARVAVVDPTRSIFEAHIYAWEWGHSNECHHLLVLEDDAFFEDVTLPGASAAVSLAVQKDMFDVLLLGYAPRPDTCVKDRGPLVRIRSFRMTHAYIVGSHLMAQWRVLKELDIQRSFGRQFEREFERIGAPIDDVMVELSTKGKYVIGQNTRQIAVREYTFRTS